MKIKAFTLTEVSIALIIMGIICTLMINSLNPNKYQEKTDKIAAQEIIALFEQATIQMLEKNKENFPTGSWMIRKADNNWQFATYIGNDVVTTENIVSLYEEFIKFDSGIINFCDFTEACNDENIQGAKLPSGAYFGIEKFDSIGACPAYYLPYEKVRYTAPKEYIPGGINGSNTFYHEKSCWGKIYFDVNGQKAPNEEGEDVFIYGMGEYGIERSSISLPQTS